MKRFGRFAILLLFVGLFITCEKIEYDPFMPYTSVRPLEFSRNTQYEYFFDMKEDSSDLYFTANYVWLTEVPDSIASWFKIVPRRGKPGEQRVTFIIAKNITNKVRTGHFSICSGDDSVRFAVTQLPPDFYVENEDTIIQLDHERQDSVLSFYANVEWTATVEEGAKSWLSIKEASGINENTKLEIHAERNDRDDDREGKIFINSKNSRCTIIVKQSHGQTFEFDTDTEISVGNEEGKDEFKFKSNVPDWEATTSDDWLEVTSETGGTGDITLQFSYKKSEEETERTGEITVRSGEASFVITVRQARARAFEFNEDTKFQYPVDNQYGTKTFEFKSNVSKWTATSSDDNWLHVEPEEGDKGDKFLIITYEETDKAYRAGSITVSDEKGDSTFVITVNQLSGRVFDFAPDTKFEYDVESELGTRKFKFISNVTKWEASPLDEWLTVYPKEGGNGNMTFDFKFEKNTKPSVRTGKIKVWSG